MAVHKIRDYACEREVPAIRLSSTEQNDQIKTGTHLIDRKEVVELEINRHNNVEQDIEPKGFLKVFEKM